MPTSKIKKDAREGKGSVPSLEKKWDKAKGAAGKKGGKQNWPLTMHIYENETKGNTVKTKVKAGGHTMGDLYRAMRPNYEGYAVTYKDYGEDGACVQLRKGGHGFNVYMADPQKGLYVVTEQKDGDEKSLGKDLNISELDQLLKTGKVQASTRLNAATRLAATRLATIHLKAVLVKAGPDKGVVRYEAKLGRLLEKTPKVKKQLDSYARKEGIKYYRHDPMETSKTSVGILGFKGASGSEPERFSAVVELNNDSMKITQEYGGHG
jgi:hypothetical protein